MFGYIYRLFVSLHLKTGFSFLFPVINKLKCKDMNKENEINDLAKLLAAQTIICTKEVLTSKEAAAYMGVSMSYLYKLTMNKEIPHYKPMGKVCYFNRLELEKWLQGNRCATETEINDKAAAYRVRKGV